RRRESASAGRQRDRSSLRISAASTSRPAATSASDCRKASCSAAPSASSSQSPGSSGSSSISVPSGRSVGEPGDFGQVGGPRPKQEACGSLVEATKLIPVDKRDDGLRGIPRVAIREKVITKWRLTCYWHPRRAALLLRRVPWRFAA